MSQKNNVAGIVLLVLFGGGGYYWASMMSVNSLEFTIIEVSLSESAYYEQVHNSALESVADAQARVDEFIAKGLDDTVYYTAAMNQLDSALNYLEEVEKSRTFIIEVGIKVENKGMLEVVLKNRQTTLYINDINLGTRAFAEEWEKLGAGYYGTYSAMWSTTSEEDAKKLFEIASYSLTMKLKAQVSSGFYSSYIEKMHQKNWSPS